MLGYMDAEALRRTLTEGRVTFWSRSRQEYWRKGDTSGNVQYVRGAALDCDGDTLLVQVEQLGPACHTGAHACFDVDPLEPVRGSRRDDVRTTTRADFDAAHRRRPPRRAGAARALRRRRDARSASTASSALGKPGTFLLESAEQGGIWSRCSFVGVGSLGVLTQGRRCTARGLARLRAARRARPGRRRARPRRSRRSRTSTQRWSTPQVEGHPPLTGGLVGFIGWEAVRQLEHLPDVPPADFDVPGQALSFVSRAGRARPPQRHRDPHRRGAQRRHRRRRRAVGRRAGAARRAAGRPRAARRRPGSPRST